MASTALRMHTIWPKGPQLIAAASSPSSFLLHYFLLISVDLFILLKHFNIYLFILVGSWVLIAAEM